MLYTYLGVEMSVLLVTSPGSCIEDCVSCWRIGTVVEGPVIVVTKDVGSTVVRISPIPVLVALVVCSRVCLYINSQNEK